MKRSGPLQRKTELRSKKELRRVAIERTASLLRRTPLGRSRPKPMSEQEQARARAWHSATVIHPCVVCRKTSFEAREAGTRLQAHHVIPQEKLRRKAAELGIDPAMLLWDKRNGAAVCEEPCHRRHTTAHRRILRAKLPPAVEAFAKEYGFVYVLERQYL